ncbi:MAG: carbohydrate ABC transporter permease, partial [Gemmatimonadetes bacterium]|nr:carbohydrate ABC transporter permease [Gemmatimonadota bacterium]
MKLPFDNTSTRIRFVALGLLGFMLAMPFIWMVGASFKSRAEIEAGGIHIVPE